MLTSDYGGDSRSVRKYFIGATDNLTYDSSLGDTCDDLANIILEREREIGYKERR